MTLEISILYVDDEPVNLMLFEQLFRRKHTVHTADSGFTGLEVLKANPEIAVIISDMKMPGMNGIEFIRQAKIFFPKKLFYILTGYEITPEIQHALESGLISKYFQKPFNMTDIEHSIMAELGAS
jgi:two-component system, response regulator, stage 0 sporulation protein F